MNRGACLPASGFGFRVSGLWKGFGFQVSGSRFRVSGFGVRDRGFRAWCRDARGPRVANPETRTPEAGTRLGSPPNTKPETRISIRKPIPETRGSIRNPGFDRVHDDARPPERKHQPLPMRLTRSSSRRRPNLPHKSDTRYPKRGIRRKPRGARSTSCRCAQARPATRPDPPAIPVKRAGQT